MTTRHDQFGELRSILHASPTPGRWRTLLELLKDAPRERREQVLLPYAAAHLGRWPMQLRKIMVDDDAHPHDLDAGILALAGHLHVACTEGTLQSLRGVDTDVEALTLEGLDLTHDTQHDALGAMLARWAPTTLAIESSTPGSRILDVLESSPVAAHLETLSLRDTRFRRRDFKRLGRMHLPALRDLDLGETFLNGKDVRSFFMGTLHLHLERLGLEKAQLTDEDFYWLRHLRKNHSTLHTIVLDGASAQERRKVAAESFGPPEPWELRRRHSRWNW